MSSVTKTGFFVGCNLPMWADLITALREHEIRFSYVCGVHDVIAKVNDGDAIFHDLALAERGVRPEYFPLRKPVPLDARILKTYQDAEIACLEISDRMDMGYTFAYRERLRLYFTCLEFWLDLTAWLQPGFVLFPETPHSVFDHTLFRVCRQKQIPTISYLQISILKQVIPVQDFEQQNNIVTAAHESLLKRYRDASEETVTRLLPKQFTDYLGKHDLSYAAAMPVYLNSRLSANKEKSSALGAVTGGDIARRLLQPSRYPALLKAGIDKTASHALKISRRVKEEAPRNYLKRPFEALEKSFISGREWRRYKRHARTYKDQLLRKYNALCETPDFIRPYIFFPLQYQPERTSSPEGGRFSNQLLALKMLVFHLPEGWQVVVKENPTQLLSHSAHGERGRLPYFYDDLKSLGRVVFVPVETSQFDLIDNARAVSTLTGTTGFEAVLRGKPALVFGHVWYLGCDGTYPVYNNDELSRAMQLVASGTTPQRSKVLLFMLALNEAGFSGFLNPKRFRAGKEETAENVKNLKNLALCTLGLDQ